MIAYRPTEASAFLRGHCDLLAFFLSCSVAPAVATSCRPTLSRASSPSVHPAKKALSRTTRNAKSSSAHKGHSSPTPPSPPPLIVWQMYSQACQERLVLAATNKVAAIPSPSPHQDGTEGFCQQRRRARKASTPHVWVYRYDSMLQCTVCNVQPGSLRFRNQFERYAGGRHRLHRKDRQRFQLSGRKSC